MKDIQKIPLWLAWLIVVTETTALFGLLWVIARNVRRMLEHL